MTDTERPLSDAGRSAEQGGGERDRREFMRRALGLGACAFGGPAIGQSLLLRAASPWSPMPPESSVSTYFTASRTNTFTGAQTIATLVTESGLLTKAYPPGTNSYTIPPATYLTSTSTATFAAPPGYTSQPITVAITQIHSYSPPATFYETLSVEGGSWTRSSKRVPSHYSASVTQTKSLSYTWTTTAPAECEQPPSPDSFGVVSHREAERIVESIDAHDFGILDFHSRRPIPSFLNFARRAGQ